MEGIKLKTMYNNTIDNLTTVKQKTLFEIHHLNHQAGTETNNFR